MLGLMKAVFALCRGIYIRGRESAKVCQSPSVRPGIVTVAAHPLLMLPASLEIIHIEQLVTSIIYLIIIHFAALDNILTLKHK